MAPHPRVVAATRAQLRAREEALRAGASHVGWKIARDFGEIEAVIGNRPVLGHLTSASLLTSGGRFPAGALREPRVETELMVELASAIEPGADPAAIERAVRGFAVALEIVDVARPPDDLEGIVAANVAHRACALGPARRGQPPHGAAARTWIGDKIRATAPLRDEHVEALGALAELLAAVGLRLEAGDRILTGSSTHVPARAGDRVAAEIDGLGRVEVQLI